jgi:hypothetical protein
MPALDEYLEQYLHSLDEHMPTLDEYFAMPALD